MKGAFSPFMLSAALQSKRLQTCTLNWQGHPYFNPSPSGALGTNQAIKLIIQFCPGLRTGRMFSASNLDGGAGSWVCLEPVEMVTASQ